MNDTETTACPSRLPWKKDKFTGPKPPLRPGHVSPFAPCILRKRTRNLASPQQHQCDGFATTLPCIRRHEGAVEAGSDAKSAPALPCGSNVHCDRGWILAGVPGNIAGGARAAGAIAAGGNGGTAGLHAKCVGARMGQMSISRNVKMASILRARAGAMTLVRPGRALSTPQAGLSVFLNTATILCAARAATARAGFFSGVRTIDRCPRHGSRWRPIPIKPCAIPSVRLPAFTQQHALQSVQRAQPIFRLQQCVLRSSSSSPVA
jgi:hypothetical protein